MSEREAILQKIFPILDVIELAHESYLSKDAQLRVIYDAYYKYIRGVEFVPSALVASEEAREEAKKRE